MMPSDTSPEWHRASATATFDCPQGFDRVDAASPPSGGTARARLFAPGRPFVRRLAPASWHPASTWAKN